MEGNSRIRTDGGQASAEAKPQAQTMQDPHHTNIDVYNDEQLLSASMNNEFSRFKAEQRTLLEQKNQIQKRIESMRREYDFIENLDARDVNYVMEKKKEHAAIMVQRNWRRIKAERDYRLSRMGKRVEPDDYEKTEEDLERIRQHKDELEQIRGYFFSSRKDKFYDKITEEERKNQLQEQVNASRKLKSDADIQKLEPIEIYEVYHRLSERFNLQFAENEAVRARAHDQLVWSEIMTKFMIDLSPEEMARANEPIQHLDRDPEDVKKQSEKLDMEAAARLQKIKSWGEIADNFSPEDKQDIVKTHRERLARHRKRKDWEAWIEEDDMDLDGERLLAEIKNYKSEHFWNTKFYV